MQPATQQEPVREGEVRGEGRPFTQVLMEQRKGVLHQELTEELATLVKAVMEQGKSGTLTLTLKVEPMEKAVDDVVYISDVVKVKAPVPAAGKSMYFADQHGAVTRNNPRQQELATGPRAVDGDH